MRSTMMYDSRNNRYLIDIDCSSVIFSRALRLLSENVLDCDINTKTSVTQVTCIRHEGELKIPSEDKERKKMSLLIILLVSERIGKCRKVSESEGKISYKLFTNLDTFYGTGERNR